jgi:hypothetical protein
MLIFGERHLSRVLARYAVHYNLQDHFHHYCGFVQADVTAPRSAIECRAAGTTVARSSCNAHDHSDRACITLQLQTFYIVRRQETGG